MPDARNFTQQLQGALLFTEFEHGEGPHDYGRARIRTFEQAGAQTTDQGLTIRLQNGDEFRVTIEQTHRGDDRS